MFRWVDMTMQPEQGIGRELSLGEVISKTFEVYRRDFSKYFVLFAVVGVIVQVVTTLAQQAFVLPILPVNPTPQQFSTWFSALFAALLLLIAVIFVVNIVFSTIAEGSAIKLWPLNRLLRDKSTSEHPSDSPSQDFSRSGRSA